MKDKKFGILGMFVSLIGLGVYNLYVFLLVSNYTSAFWASYIFTTIAFFSQIVVALIFSKSDADRKFLQLPLFYIGWFYFLIQFATGIVFMVIPMSVVLPLIMQTIILAVYLLLILTSTGVKEQITKAETNINTATFSIRMLTIDAEHLYTSEIDENKKTELKKLYEAIRYSDPVSSSETVQNIDVQINVAFKELSTIVTSCSLEDLNREIKTILDLLAKRNLLCKSKK